MIASNLDMINFVATNDHSIVQSRDETLPILLKICSKNNK